MNELDQLLSETTKSTNIILVGLTKKMCLGYLVSNIVLSIIIIIVSVLAYRNNAQWIELWNSYEYVTEETTYTQDGEGVNSVNTGEMGDLTNGAEADD